MIIKACQCTKSSQLYMLMFDLTGGLDQKFLWRLRLMVLGYMWL